MKRMKFVSCFMLPTHYRYCFCIVISSYIANVRFYPVINTVSSPLFPSKLVLDLRLKVDNFNSFHFQMAKKFLSQSVSQLRHRRETRRMVIL